jgi:hypothetical protein
VAAPYARRPHPPGIYRAARALRRAGTVAIVLIVVFLALVAYSAVQVVRSAPRIASPSVAMEANGTVGLTTSFSLTNAGFLPIQSFALHFLVENASGGALVSTGDRPTTIASGASVIVPVAIYLPLNDTAATSLLTEDQYLHWNVWGNATYGYLFPVSISISTDRSWGAPFDDLRIAVGTPVEVGGQVEVPFTISFANDASFADQGTLDVEVEPASGPACGTTSIALNVAPGNTYDSTQNMPIATGCNPSGGQVDAQYVVGGTVIPLPPEPIP